MNFGDLKRKAAVSELKNGLEMLGNRTLPVNDNRRLAYL